MSSDGDRKNSNQLVSLASTAVGVVSPVGGLATLVVGDVLKRLLGAAAAKKFGRWLSDVAATSKYGTPERLVEVIEEHADKHWASENVMQGLRMLLDSVDPAVVPSLAALGAHYFDEERTPDRFYKRCARLLADCTQDDLVVLSRILESLAAHADEGRVEISGGEMAEGWEDVVFEFVSDPCGSERDHAQWRLEGSRTMQNVLRLLRAHDFATAAVTRDRTPMPYASTSGDLRATSRIADDQLHELLGLRRFVVVSR